MAAKRRSSRRGSLSRRFKRARRRIIDAFHAYTAPITAWIAALAMALAFYCLHIIGAPPMLRINALWVQDHRPQVIAALWSSGATICTTLIAVCYRRNRLAMLILWAAAIVLASTVYANRIEIIWTVVWNHM